MKSGEAGRQRVRAPPRPLFAQRRLIIMSGCVRAVDGGPEGLTVPPGPEASCKLAESCSRRDYIVICFCFVFFIDYLISKINKQTKFNGWEIRFLSMSLGGGSFLVVYLRGKGYTRYV